MQFRSAAFSVLSVVALATVLVGCSSKPWTSEAGSPQRQCTESVGPIRLDSGRGFGPIATRAYGSRIAILLNIYGYDWRFESTSRLQLAYSLDHAPETEISSDAFVANPHSNNHVLLTFSGLGKGLHEFRAMLKSGDNVLTSATSCIRL
jgi:hypothetical protein